MEKVEKVVGEGSTRRGVLLDKHIEAFSSLADAQSGNLVGGRVFIGVLFLQLKTAISDFDLLRSNRGTAYVLIESATVTRQTMFIKKPAWTKNIGQCRLDRKRQYH